MGQMIQEMAETERPRERLHTKGAGALREAELLAILLRVGTVGASAVEVGEQLLQRFQGLHGLAQASLDDLASVRGVGPTKAVQLKAAFEIGARLARQRVDPGPIDTPERVCEIVADDMRMLNYESVRVLLLNTRLRLTGVEEISRGLLDQALVHAREVFSHAVARRAYGIILVHNHPSGDPSPSSADVRMTETMKNAGQTLTIPLMDHVIIGRPNVSHPGGWFSFRSAGML